MREILFRGKRKDNGKWVEGYYAMQSNHACFEDELKYTHFIFKDIFLDFNLGGLQEFEVIPETVGQYTGLTDKNGKKIFEGDILEFSDRLVVVFWRSNLGSWDCEFLKFTNRENSRDSMLPPNWKYESKVICNIHDNPELLEGESNE